MQKDVKYVIIFDTHTHPLQSHSSHTHPLHFPSMDFAPQFGVFSPASSYIAFFSSYVVGILYTVPSNLHQLGPCQP